ncbi:hypothetical protein FoTM2_010278 [Fusarium oxysporum f. sp. vasinfectum]|nr:hypothetical protein FoTM2_010278 [Fusarium oxysporum f. sp. vasinfectum]
MPVTTGPPVLSKEDAESLVSHALGSFTNPDQRNKETSQDNYARDYARSGADKGAIVGGTVAGGIIICVTVFFGVLILKKYLARQGKYNKRVVDGKPLCPDTETPGTTSSTPTRTPWRQTFHHRISVPASAQPIPLPAIPSKAAQMLGVEDTNSTPLVKTPLFGERYAKDSYSSILFVTEFSGAKPSTEEPSIAAPSEESSSSRSAAACPYL